MVSIHIQGITAKAYQALGLLRRTFRQAIPRQSKKSLYISFIRSVTYLATALSYGMLFLQSTSVGATTP